MPTNSNPRRKSRESNNKTRQRRLVMERASSFHKGRASVTSAEESVVEKQLGRPRTAPDLTLAGRGEYNEVAVAGEGQRPRLSKLLLNVTVHGSAGVVQVVMRPESTAGDLVAAAVREYVKEGRRPVLVTSDPLCFDLHYSQFSLESIDRDEKLVELGSRNFFVCPRKLETASLSDGYSNDAISVLSSAVTCGREADVASGSCFDWLRLVDFLL